MYVYKARRGMKRGDENKVISGNIFAIYMLLTKHPESY